LRLGLLGLALRLWSEENRPPLREGLIYIQNRIRSFDKLSPSTGSGFNLRLWSEDNRPPLRESKNAYD